MCLGFHVKLQTSNIERQTSNLTSVTNYPFVALTLLYPPWDRFTHLTVRDDTACHCEVCPDRSNLMATSGIASLGNQLAMTTHSNPQQSTLNPQPVLTLNSQPFSGQQLPQFRKGRIHIYKAIVRFLGDTSKDKLRQGLR